MTSRKPGHIQAMNLRIDPAWKELAIGVQLQSSVALHKQRFGALEDSAGSEGSLIMSVLMSTSCRLQCRIRKYRG